MKPLSRFKKEEYATKLTLIGVFLSVFAAFVSRFRGGEKRLEDPRLKPLDLVMLSLATLRLGRMLSYDLIMESVRWPFAKTVPDQTGAGFTVVARDGSGVEHSIGQLLSCPICSGTWIAAGLVYALHAIPNPTRIFLEIFSITGLTEIFNALIEALSWSGEVARAVRGEKEEE
jgi:hypothetical protein